MVVCAFFQLLISLLSLASSAIAEALSHGLAGRHDMKDRNLNGHYFRDLSFELIAGYQPITPVTDHNLIDLDQAMIGDLILSSSLDEAYSIYELGGFSKPVAILSLSIPLPVTLNQGDPVVGVGIDGQEVRGRISNEEPLGASQIRVNYEPGRQTCQVGGLLVPFIDRCFEEVGKIVVQGVELEYSYDILTDSVNERTLSSFSAQARNSMFNCPTCPYVDYQTFYQYYGVFDYAHQWIEAAYNGIQTQFLYGNLDFAMGDLRSRGEALSIGTVVLTMYMQVIREMEGAIDDCTQQCPIESCNSDDQTLSWDRAVAYYTGSLEGGDGSGNGVLLYSLADQVCSTFRTCTNGVEGTSNVNQKIFALFRKGKDLLLSGTCEQVRTTKEEIVHLMKVPLIQATLQDVYNYSVSLGTFHAVSLIPYVYACNEMDETILYNSIKHAVVGDSSSTNSPPEFKVVKEALERNYECMGVTCEEVGGIWDVALNQYVEHGSPCNLNDTVEMEEEEEVEDDVQDTVARCINVTVADAKDDGLPCKQVLEDPVLLTQNATEEDTNSSDNITPPSGTAANSNTVNSGQLGKRGLLQMSMVSSTILVTILSGVFYY